MRIRELCPFHKEDTPSLVRRKSDWFCYGACGRAYSFDEVEKAGVKADREYFEDEGEDLTESLSYINSLESKNIRGFKFPCDQNGYYIVWPNKDYYKYRRYQGTPKYIGAKAPVPMFWVRKGVSHTLFMVEGEINALSVAKAFESKDVCSPSSSTFFKDDTLSKYLPELQKYATIVVVLDKDLAGAKALSRMRIFFKSKNIPFVHYVQLDPDANEILCKSGKEKLKEEIDKQLPFGV